MATLRKEIRRLRADPQSAVPAILVIHEFIHKWPQDGFSLAQVLAILALEKKVQYDPKKGTNILLVRLLLDDQKDDAPDGHIRKLAATWGAVLDKLAAGTVSPGRLKSDGVSKTAWHPVKSSKRGPSS